MKNISPSQGAYGVPSTAGLQEFVLPARPARRFDRQRAQVVIS
jgi:hypothetical protein